MAAYTVIPGQAGGFAVEIRSAEGKVEVVDGFETESQAQDWMIERQRLDERDNTVA